MRKIEKEIRRREKSNWRGRERRRKKRKEGKGGGRRGNKEVRKKWTRVRCIKEENRRGNKENGEE